MIYTGVNRRRLGNDEDRHSTGRRRVPGAMVLASVGTAFRSANTSNQHRPLRVNDNLMDLEWEASTRPEMPPRSTFRRRR
jgi:hypothetical protein